MTGTRHTDTAIVLRFFEAFGERDLEGMTRCCADSARFWYVPFEFPGRQRVVRGDGAVSTVGRAIWAGLFAAFPDLALTVDGMVSDDAGKVAALVTLSGTQASPWGLFTHRGLAFESHQCHVLHVTEDRLIDQIHAYRDARSMGLALGHAEAS